MSQVNCQVKGCPNFGRYCRRLHPSDKAKLTIEQPEKPYRIPKESATRKQENKTYKKVSKELKSKEDDCQIKSPVCINRPTYPHHIRGRIGKKYTDKKEMIRACNPCNGWVESHPALAEKLGFKKSKHEVNYKREK